MYRVAAGRLAVWLRRLRSCDAVRSMSSPGIEPGLRPSRSRVRIRHTPRTRYPTLRPSPARESDPALRLRRPPCARHTRGEDEALARNRTRSTTFGGSRARPSHSKGLTRHTATPAGTQGFEPCPRALETRCSPRSTSLSKSAAEADSGESGGRQPPVFAAGQGADAPPLAFPGTDTPSPRIFGGN